MKTEQLPRYYNPYGNKFIVPGETPPDTGIERFVKGSIWRTTKEISVRGTSIPSGTTFEVMYPRRRESDIVAVKFLSDIRWARDRARTSIAPRPRKGGKQGRFHRADELLFVGRLGDPELVSVPAEAAEYYIREVGTDRLWSGGREGPSAFAAVPFPEANHYVSIDNARVGVVTLLFRQHRRLMIEDERVGWEIVGYDALTKEVVSVTDISSIWWNNMVRMARFSKELPKPSKDAQIGGTMQQRVRRLANAAPIDDRQWDFVVFCQSVNKKAGEVIREKMSNAGIADYFATDDNTFLLMHDTDRVMMKLLFADDIAAMRLV